MISKIRNKWFTVNFVLRHRWEEGDYTDYELRQLKSTLKLGMWAKTYEADVQWDKPKIANLKKMFPEYYR